MYSIADLDRDESIRQREFPVVRNRIFMAHAGVCPLPRCVYEAGADYLRQCGEGNQEVIACYAIVKETRKLAAQLLRVAESEIALIGPTSLGLSMIANGLRWNPGDEVVYYQDDYPANVYPWMSASRKFGVGLKPVETPNLGEITIAHLEKSITSRTRMVALASAHFLSGYRIDVKGIGRYLREKGILFCIDGIQTLGAFPFDGRDVDFLSADSHKWLLGPCAAGIVYVRNEVQDQLDPIIVGADNVYSPDFVAQAELKVVAGARRYESGVLNFGGIASLRASLEMLLGLGIERTSEKLLRLKKNLETELDKRGFELLGPSHNEAEASGITTVSHRSLDLTALSSGLAEKNIFISPRKDRSGNHYIRFSPHFYNTSGELVRVYQALDELIGKQ